MADNKTGIDGVGTEGSYHLDDKDMKMSISHRKDTLDYNFRHAEEHLKKAKETYERLVKAGIKYDIPKSLLDLNEFFEEAADYHNEEPTYMEKPHDKLKRIAKEHFGTK